MRIPIALAALAFGALAGCSPTSEVAGKAAAPGKEWTMQVVGDDAGAVYVITGPDGQTAAARVADGVSTLVDDAAAQSLVGETRAALAETPEAPERVDIAAPGFSLKVNADDDSVDGAERGKVAIRMGGVSVDVDGEDAGGAGRGAVRISGVNAQAAGDFIDEIDDLSPEVKAQMRTKLGL